MAISIGTISHTDKKTLAAMDALLEKEGIRRDRNLDYSCGLFDENGALLATGSCFGSTLRCLAVDTAHRGEGLMNQIVSHLMEYQMQRGNAQVFLYTKKKNSRIFTDLGFYEIASVGDTLTFMENRKTGFSRYLAGLEKTRREGEAAAIVMNANPFTLGHLHLIQTAAQENPWVHLFLLSEEAGPIPFAVRKQLVLEGIAGLSNVIVHDSGPYLISSATFPSYFLRDEDSAITAQARLDLAIFGRIAQTLSITRRYAGQEPASHVTAIYNQVMAQALPGMGIAFREIPRLCVDGQPVSASSVRQAIHDGVLGTVSGMFPPSTLAFFQSSEAAPVITALKAAENPRHY